MTRLRATVTALLLAVPASVMAQEAMDGARELLTAERITALPPRERDAWTSYVATSRRLHALDTASMNRELRAVGRTEMTKATYSAPDFDLGRSKTDDWFGSDSARRLADAVLTYQTPSGGWSKRTDMTRPRAQGQSYYSETELWHYIPTMDNGATTGQLRFLARVQQAQPDRRYAEAIDRGMDYLLSAQQPNGCWPQDFPLDGSYHDAITFNDDAVVNVLEVVDAYAAGRMAVGTPDRRERAAATARHAIECIVATQVRVNGARTVWGQQHDPLTLEVVPARRYELAGLAGRESAGILTYLMSLPRPSGEVVAAVRAAAAWFRANAIMGLAYDYRTGLRTQEGAGPIWARLTEISTGRPIFSNRDGVKLYDWNQLTDRRSGYAWYSTEPGSALARYDKWEKRLSLGERAPSGARLPVRKQ